MILDNIEIIDNFSLHFNCRLTSLDFVDNVSELIALVNNKGGEVIESAIFLPCGSAVILDQLVKFDYPNLLKEICKRVTINKELLDIYNSEMQIELVGLYVAYLRHSNQQIEIKLNPETHSFAIICQDLFVNLTISAFSQFHTEILAQLVHFNELIEKIGKYNSITSDSNLPTDNLFINSKVPTAFSYFIIAYLAENLYIRLKPVQDQCYLSKLKD